MQYYLVDLTQLAHQWPYLQLLEGVQLLKKYSNINSFIRTAMCFVILNVNVTIFIIRIKRNNLGYDLDRYKITSKS